MKVFVAIAITAFFCASFGFFSQTLSASSNLVALSDEDMMQRNGGKWTDEVYYVGNGSYANCPTPNSQNPCPDTSIHEYNHTLYKCIPCYGTVTSWTELDGCAKQTKSTCNTYGDPTMWCDYDSWISLYYRGCWTWTGNCP